MDNYRRISKICNIIFAAIDSKKKLLPTMDFKMVTTKIETNHWIMKICEKHYTSYSSKNLVKKFIAFI